MVLGGVSLEKRPDCARIWLVKRVVILVILFFGLGIGIWGVTKDRTGQVAGVETVQAAELPKTLLPVEHYNGSPLVDSVQEMLKLLNVNIYPEDIVKSFPDPALGIGSTITVYRATPVIVDDATVKTTYRTWVKTVKELFEEKQIELGDKDKLDPSLDSEIKPDMTITITRVTVVEVTKKEPIAFKIITENDSELDRCDTKIIQKGQNGQKLLTYQVTRENGKEVGRQLIKTEKIKEPVEEIIAKGTREILLGEGRATWFAAPKLTAAHNGLKRGSIVEVIDLKTGKSVTVKILGGGIKGGAVIDLSPDDFAKLAPIAQGVIQVKLVKACP